MLMFIITPTICLFNIEGFRMTKPHILHYPCTPRLTCIAFGSPLRIPQHITAPQPCTPVYLLKISIHSQRQHTLQCPQPLKPTSWPPWLPRHSVQLRELPLSSSVHTSPLSRRLIVPAPSWRCMISIRSLFWRHQRAAGRLIRRWS